MHQLSLHYRTSHEINSTWLARILLLIFCLLILVWPSLMSCSIQQGLFRMECWNLALPPCFSQQSTAVCPRLGLWSKETGSFGCELQPACGASIEVSTLSSYTELSFLLWWADWKRAAVLFQLLYSLLCRDIIHLLCAASKMLCIQMFERTDFQISLNNRGQVISFYASGFYCSCLHLK